MPLDYNILNRGVSLLDNQRLQQDFELKKQAAQLANQSAANIYKTQVLSAAAGTGDQNVVNNAIQHLNGSGIDTSDVPTDLPTLSKYADAARLAQSPLGTLFQAQQKIVGNNIAGIQALGGVAQAKAAGQYQDVPNLTSFGLPSVSGVNSMPTEQPTVQPAATPQPNIQPQPARPKLLSNGLPQLPIPKLPNMGNNQPEPPAIDGDITTVPVTNGGLPPYNPPAPEPGDSLATIKQKQDAYDVAYKMNNADIIEQNKAASSAKGKGIGDTITKAGTAKALSDRVMLGLDALDKINESGKLPYAGNIVGPETQTAISNRFGANPIAHAFGINQDAANATQAFTKANKQQVLVGLQDMLAAAPQGSRLSRQLLNLVDMANSIDTNASQESIRNQIGILRSEIKNVGLAETNTLQNLTGGKEQPYNTIPINTAAPNQSDNTSGFKYLGVKK